MTAQLLATAAGVSLSLIFSYVPGFRTWFDKLSGNYKRLVMLGFLFLAALGLYGVACLGRYNGVTCDVDGAWKTGEVFVLAAIANQTAYGLSPKLNK